MPIDPEVRGPWKSFGRAVPPLLLALACGAEEAPRRAGTGEDPWVIGVSQGNRGEPWRVRMDADIAAAAVEHPEICVAFEDARNDPREQQKQIRAFVEQGVDLLVVCPQEAEPLEEVVVEAAERGIPVILLDRAVPGNRHACLLVADDEGIGRAAAEWARTALEGRGRIVELKGRAAASRSRDLHRGFREALGEDPELAVVYEAEMDGLAPRAREAMGEALEACPTIDLVFAHNDAGAHGAWLAAKEAGREREMLFVGVDALPHEGQQHVRRDILDATFLHPTGGREAIEVALAILRGEAAPRTILLGTRLFTPENVEEGGEAVAGAEDEATAPGEDGDGGESGE